MNVMNFIVESIANITDAFLGTLFVLKFNKGNFKSNRYSIFVVIFCSIISTAFLFINSFSLLHSIIITLILFTFSFSIKTRTTFTAIIAPILFEIILILSNTLLALTLSFFFNIDITTISSGFSIERCLLLFFSKVLIGSVSTLIIRFYVPGKQFKVLDLILYLLSPSITIISLYTFVSMTLNENLEKYYILIIISSVGLVLTNILTLAFFTKYTKNEQEKYEMQIILHLQEIEQQKYNEAAKLYESVRILKHDLKEQIRYVKEMLNKNALEDAEKHIEKLELAILSTKDIVHTGNRVIDSILYSKITNNPNITFIISGTIDDLSNVGDIELISLLTNMLDNAIEATIKHNEKIIEVSFLALGGFQNISCKNPITISAIDNNPLLLTTKSNKEIHGYGIKSMRKAVEALNGMLEFYEKDNYFICHVAIPY